MCHFYESQIVCYTKPNALIKRQMFKGISYNNNSLLNYK